MKKMKILYVITSTEMGGAEKALLDLAVFISKAHQVKVISLKPLGEIAASLKQSGLEVISFNMKWYNQNRIRKELAAAIAAFHPDMIHAMLYRAIEYTRLACAGKKRILVTTPHFDLSKKSFLLRWIDYLLKDLDTLTVAESFSTARYLIEKQRYRKEKVYLLPNSIDKGRFFADDTLRRRKRKEYGISEEETVFISVARLCREKDPMTLLQAFRNVLRNHPQVRLVYVGDGTERDKLEEYIQQNQLGGKVLLAGSQTDINGWLNMGDVFVLTSIEESLPLALLEALRVGLPCVVSRVGDMPLWVEHGKNGFVVHPQDITLLSCVLAELAQDKKQRLEMGRISEEISRRMTDTSQQYQHLYQQLKNNSFHVKTNG